jgi:arsenate reductase (thioredoxin)
MKEADKSHILPAVQEAFDRALHESAAIAESRKTALRELAGIISAHREEYGMAELIFICTHNSRRSHLSHIWAQAAAVREGFNDIHCFSGGTEATAFHPNAIEALRRDGFGITCTREGSNPRYAVRYSATADPIIAFSKEYSDPFNPSKHFIAVMTCSDADEGCPVVIGAENRISLPYDDPKSSDGSGEENAVYGERSRQIAREMLYAMQHVQAS